MMNIDQARVADPIAKKTNTEVYETEEKDVKLTIPEGWSSLKNKKEEKKDATS